MSTATFPTVSIILPTLNAGALLENCLASIATQTWPKDRLEIVIADAFSTDDTRDIAKKFGATVIDDRGKNMEEGKRLALQHATGEYIIFVDADNEFTHPDCIELAVRALEKNPQSLGVESYYLPSAKMSSFCRYVTARLYISDPLCWMLTTNGTRPDNNKTEYLDDYEFRKFDLPLYDVLKAKVQGHELDFTHCDCDSRHASEGEGQCPARR